MTNDPTQIMAPKRDYFAALDGFRGLLAVFVAVYHTIWLSHPQSWEFFNNGPVIIDLFFAFSGFLMWRLYEDNMRNGDEIKSFMKRRIARLYPLHFFMLMVFLAFAIVRLMAHKVGIADVTPGEVLPFEAGAPEGWSSLLQNLVLLHAVGLSDSLTFNPPSWTIGAEFCTYIVFAMMMYWLKPKRVFHFVIIAVGVAVIYFGLSTIKPNMNITHDYGFLRCLAGFFTGLLACEGYKYLKPWLQRQSSVVLNSLEVFALLGSLAFVIICGGKAQFFVGPVIFVFVIIFAFDGGLISKFMSQPLFKYLAKISYSVYMTHVIISIAFGIVLERLLGGLPVDWAGDFWLIIYLCVVLGVSHFTYHFIEVPGGRLIRDWGKSKKQVAKASSSV